MVLLLGLAVRLPGLAEPLFEGAAGKQTHTAMVARNLQRGRASWLRPMVDDVGRPGYFVKELPLVAGLAAVVHGFTGAPLGAVGRSIGAVAWLIGAILLFSLVRRDRSPRVAALIGRLPHLRPLCKASLLPLQPTTYPRPRLRQPSCRTAVTTMITTTAQKMAGVEAATAKRQSTLTAAAAVAVAVALTTPRSKSWCGCAPGWSSQRMRGTC